MTVIRPNSISGVTSITALANEINVFKHDGVLAGLQLNGVNHHTSSGVSTFHTLNVLGNVSVGGTLTYQDVTNVDSVGIITAQSTIDAQGDVSIADKIIHTGDENTSIRFPSADTIRLETGGVARLTVDSSGNTLTSGGLYAQGDLYIADKIIHTGDTNTAIRFPVGDVISAETNGAERLRITSAGTLLLGTSTGALANGNGIVIADATAARLSLKDTTNGVTGTDGFDVVQTGTDAYLYHRENGNMIFGTNATERLRIDSNGFLGIDNASPVSSFASARNLVIGTASGNHGMTIMSGTSNSGHIEFSDGTSSDAEKTAGGIRYYHDSDYMRFNTGGGTERLRIDSAGLLGLNVTPSYSGLFGGSQKGMHIGGTTAPFLRITSSTSSQGDLILQAGNSGADVQMGNLTAGGDIVFWNKPSGGSLTERLRITESGNIGINESSPQQLLHVHNDTNYQGILINGNGAPRIAFARSTTTTGEWSVGIDGTNGTQFVINNSNDNSQRKLIVSNSGVSAAGTLTAGGSCTAYGNFVVGTAGNGIDFSNDANGSMTNSEVLDDYEEGYYYPAAYGTSSTTSAYYYSSENKLGYVKIGKLVTIMGRLRLQADNYAGGLRMTLPYAAVQGSNTSNSAMSAVGTHGVNFDSDDMGLFLEIFPNTSYADFIVTQDNQGWINANNNYISANDYLAFHLSYVTND